MLNYQENTNNSALLNAIKYLRIKFPVAEIVRRTGYSKSVVSTYLKENANPSGEFLKKFEECFEINLNTFEESKKNILSEPKEDIYTNSTEKDLRELLSCMEKSEKLFLEVIRLQTILRKNNIEFDDSFEI